MPLLQRIDEHLITSYELFGEDINRIQKTIEGLIDIMMNDNSSEVDYSFFDLRGTVLLYGIPGIGKTSVMNNCMRYGLKEYGSDCHVGVRPL